jgi:NAD(P)H dehydrogenase (quinone)
MMPANSKATPRDALNYLGSSSGAMAQTPGDAGVDEMVSGDLETAKQFGARVAAVAARFNK